MNWRENKYAKYIRVGKLVAEYYLFSTQVFPYTKCKVRIWEEEEGTFIGLPNISINKPEKKIFDSAFYRGETIDETLNGLISNLLTMIVECEAKLERKLEDEDYEYSDYVDF